MELISLIGEQTRHNLVTITEPHNVLWNKCRTLKPMWKQHRTTMERQNASQNQCRTLKNLCRTIMELQNPHSTIGKPSLNFKMPCGTIKTIAEPSWNITMPLQNLTKAFGRDWKRCAKFFKKLHKYWHNIGFTQKRQTDHTSVLQTLMRPNEISQVA